MTATDTIRAMLDERGVEHVDAEDGHTQHTWWSDGDHEICASNSGERLAVYNLTPEQAIEATLGRGECEMVCSREYIECKVDFFECSECGWSGAIDDMTASCEYPRYCPSCGKRVRA